LIVRKNQRKPFNGRKGEGTGYKYEAIAPGVAHGLFETFVMRPPFETSSSQLNFQHGGQEMIFVLRGQMEISLPHEKVVLQSGDCIMFSGRLPHRSFSIGTQQAEALVIVTSEKAQLPVFGKSPHRRTIRSQPQSK